MSTVNINNITTKQIGLFIFFAYAFSFLIRMIWVFQFQDNPNFLWNGQLMINTNDGYFFASGVQKELFGLHQENPLVPGLWSYSIIALSAFFTKITPFSLETIILYMPAIISSLVVIPIILISKLYKNILWGFLAALLGSIAWSYYNRTMIGYYDTDMFSAMAPMFILYFLMKSTIDFNLRSALYASIAIAIYPFLYDQGQSLIYAMGIIYALYMVFYHRKEYMTYASLILIFVSLLPMPLISPDKYFVKVLIAILLYFGLKNFRTKQKNLVIATTILFIGFLFFGNVFELILGKIATYTATGTQAEGLHFYSVVQTVREASKIPFFPVLGQSCISERISGSAIGFILAVIGYIILVIRKKEFILALPLIGIGIFSHWGGLRFTVYAVPVSALSIIYLLFILGDFFKDKKIKYIFILLASAGIIYPNIKHIVEYKVPTVLNRVEVQDLVNLNKVSDTKDYTLSWWDYGYPIWYYSDTSTLIDGGKHNNDNFIISKIMQTTSPELAANLSRLAVETYVDSNYSIAANTIFKNKTKDQIDPNLLLESLKNDDYKLPKKSRNIYLYFPYRMLSIFPTVAVFGNLDLTTGQKERQITFYPTTAVANKEGILSFRNGIVFDAQRGIVTLGNQKVGVKNFIITQLEKDGKIKLQSQRYSLDGKLIVIYMKNYGKFIVMDVDTFYSMYVQMFILGKYNKNLFELVVSSPYSKIYKLKK